MLKSTNHQEDLVIRWPLLSVGGEMVEWAWLKWTRWSWWFY